MTAIPRVLFRIPSSSLSYLPRGYSPVLRPHCSRTLLRLHRRSFSTNPPTQPDEPPRRPTPSHVLRPQPHVQHDHKAQERNLDINIPFNPPGGGGGPGPGGSGPSFQLTGSPLADAALTTIIGLGMVFFGGVAYVAWYKKRVLDKIEQAFAPGYDPALELATHQGERSENDDLLDDIPWTESLRRREQDGIDRIVQGGEQGHYFMMLGPKGSGKGSMIYSSMADVAADGIAVAEACPDLEVFRLRLGKALNFEFHEDSQTGLFQRRDPREGGPALDIERAMNKLEKVALRCYKKRGKPLVLIINNVHFFKNDEEGREMILQLQQRAESWAASGILTMVFSTDDFWPFYVMRRAASRMHVVNIYDLDGNEAMHAAGRLRRNTRLPSAPQSIFKEVVSMVGGRLAYLSKVTKSHDMIAAAKSMLDIEKAWLLSQVGLIVDCDDDVMDEQKWSSCSWLLLREFVNVRKEQEAAFAKERNLPEDSSPSDFNDLPLPVIPYWKCRQIMTRADFLEELDKRNVLAIDVEHNVRPDSMLILHAAREIVGEDGFDDALDSVRGRIEEIESLQSPAWPVRWMRMVIWGT
ncbi:hypothetical protein DL96DRAFT_1174418 [Flagelloscypha sp. PMI_526]|nr:hypothetical protein DL96DRAFT_1174418 [Flagelloscypha sp. PMI_526]